MHKNARLTPRGRERTVRQVTSGQTPEAVAEAVGVCRGPFEEIERLRRQRWTGKQIAAATGVSPATVSRVLRRLGLNKLGALEPAEPVRRLNVSIRVSSSISISNSSGGSALWATASLGDIPVQSTVTTVSAEAGSAAAGRRGHQRRLGETRPVFMESVV